MTKIHAIPTADAREWADRSVYRASKCKEVTEEELKSFYEIKRVKPTHPKFCHSFGLSVFPTIPDLKQVILLNSNRPGKFVLECVCLKTYGKSCSLSERRACHSPYLLDKANCPTCGHF